MSISSKILVVDDDPSILHALSARLIHLGHRVEARPDALTAIAEIRDVDPDIAIIDINLPGTNGFDLARKLDEHTRATGKTVNKIFLTASKDPLLKEEALALGATGYLEKPYTPNDLLAVLEQCAQN